MKRETESRLFVVSVVLFLLIQLVCSVSVSKATALSAVSTNPNQEQPLSNCLNQKIPISLSSSSLITDNGQTIPLSANSLAKSSSLTGHPRPTASVFPNGTLIPTSENEGASAPYRWWIIDYWSGPNGLQGMNGQFTAISNTIGGLASTDNVKILPLNLAYGFTNNFVWYQFSIQFNSGGGVSWNIQDNSAPQGSGGTITYHLTTIGISYVVGHNYVYSIYVSGSNVIFSITDRVSSASWSDTFTPPSTSVVFNNNCFSPASAVEGYHQTIVPSSLSTVPYFQFTVNTFCTSHSSGIYSDNGVPSGVGQYEIYTATLGRWHWAMVKDLSQVPSPSTDYPVSYPQQITLGQQAEIDVWVENLYLQSPGSPSAWQTINIAFPGNPSVSSIAIGSGTDSLLNAKAYGPNDQVRTAYSDGIRTSVGYPMVEGGVANWQVGAKYHLQVFVTPSSAGSFSFYVKSVAAAIDNASNWDPHAPTSSSTNIVIDGQSEYSTYYTITVVNPQYYLAVSSTYDSPSPTSGYFNAGTSIIASVSSPVSGTTGTRYVCTGWTGTGSVPASGTTNSVTFPINQASSITWNWKTQYYLTVNSAYDSPGGGGWYDSATTAYASLSTGTVSGGTGVEYVFTGWTGDASGAGLTSNGITMNGPKTATANWKTQFYLTMSTSFGSVSPSNGWFDAGSAVTISASAPLAGSGERYVWNGWTGSGTGSYTGTNNPATNAVTMNAPISETASWTHQYQVSFAVSPSGSGTTTPSGTGVWENAGSLSISATYNSGYSFSSWTSSGPITFTNANAASTTATISGTGTITANFVVSSVSVTFGVGGMSSDTGSATVLTIDSTPYTYAQLPKSFSWTVGSTHSVSASSPVSAGTGKEYHFSSWTNGDGLSGLSGTYTVSASLATVTANWQTFYYLTISGGLYSPSSGWISAGSTVAISSNAPSQLPGERFVWNGWTGTGSGSYSGTNNPATIVMSGPITEVASWIFQKQVTFTHSGLSADASGTIATVNGVAKTYSDLPFSTWINYGGSVIFSYTGTVSSSNPNEQYILTGANASSPLTITSATTVTGSYKTQYKVSFNVSPSGSGTTSPSGTSVWTDSGSLSIQANPNSGYTFASWSSNTGSITFANSNSASTTATVSGTGTITANFNSASSQAGFLVVKGNDNKIYYCTSTSQGVWNSWVALPGSTIDTPAAAVCNNELCLVVRGSDGNTLWYSYVNLATNAFSGWTSISGSTPSAPTLTSNGNTLALVVRGGDNRIYYRLYASQTWTSWSTLPSGTTLTSPAAALVGNTLHIVVKGSDGATLWYSYVNPTSQAFSGWTLLSGSTPSTPTLTSNGATLALVVRGGDSRVYYRLCTISTLVWTGWSALPSGTTMDSPAATIVGGDLWFVVRGSDGSSLWTCGIDMSSSEYYTWTLIGGSTPSKPTLTS